MAAFAGYDMPISYPMGAVEEHLLCRRSVGLFDIDHMGQVELRGPGADEFLSGLVSARVLDMPEGEARYALLLDESGFVLDDLFVYRLPGRWWIVVNASNRRTDIDWMRSRAPGGVTLEDRSDDTYMIAVQGPRAVELLDAVSDRAVSALPRFTAREMKIGGIELLFGRTGYTGEDGGELFFPADSALELWEFLLAEGEKRGIETAPVGLAARDSLRFEAGMPLHGHEISPSINPIEAGLKWACDFSKDFVGRRALEAAAAAGPARRLVVLDVTGRGPARGLRSRRDGERRNGERRNGERRNGEHRPRGEGRRLRRGHVLSQREEVRRQRLRPSGILEAGNGLGRHDSRQEPGRRRRQEAAVPARISEMKPAKEKRMKIDPECRYRSSHEYARKDGSEIVVGISDHAQDALGDIVFVEMAEVGKTFAQGEAIGVVESVKAASDIYAPMSGTITAVNAALQGDPVPREQGLLRRGLARPDVALEAGRVGRPPRRRRPTKKNPARSDHALHRGYRRRPRGHARAHRRPGTSRNCSRTSPRPRAFPSSTCRLRFRSWRRCARSRPWPPRTSPPRRSAWFLGAGAYYHFIPAVVPAIASRGEFLSAYTPYQPEVSQGTLQAIFEYQSMAASLLGMEVVNASHYDGATALAEAVLMAYNAAGGAGTRDRVVLCADIHPEYKDVLRSYLSAYSARVEETALPPEGAAALADASTFCVVAPYPGFSGAIGDLAAAAAATHAAGALLVVQADPIMCGLLKSPGELGADIVAAEGQALGNPMCFGGPFLGMMGAKAGLVRKLPGRLVGQARDAAGRRGFVLTLTAREQHIRREKAVSNICSNQGLAMLQACVYLAAMGRSGLRAVAELCWNKSHYAASLIAGIPGFAVRTDRFFKEFLVEHAHSGGRHRGQAVAPRRRAGAPPVPLLSRAEARASRLRHRDVHERSDRAPRGVARGGREMNLKAEPLLFELSSPGRRCASLPSCDVPPTPLPEELARDGLDLPELDELGLVRHFTRLSQKNFSIDTEFYPLGSCTMKYNPKVDEQAASLPGWRNIHPLAGEEFSQGALELIHSLQKWMCEIGGFAAGSLQPAAGAQGELAGVLVIRAYHAARVDGRRRDRPRARLRPWHQPRHLLDGRIRDQDPALRRRGRRGHGRAQGGPGRPLGRGSRRDHDNQSQHPRPLRPQHRGDLPPRARSRRPRLRRRRQHERPRRRPQARLGRHRRHALQPAQDLLDAARRRRSGRRLRGSASRPRRFPPRSDSGQEQRAPIASPCRRGRSDG